MPKYYHSTIPPEEPLEIMNPERHFEMVSERTGCPEHVYSKVKGKVGYLRSDILELAFAKSPEAAILAGATTQCRLQQGDICVLDIYETYESPDVDISKCENDFSLIEEVRYRRPILVKKSFSIQLNRDFIRQIITAYRPEKIIVSDIDKATLECLKIHIRKRLREGKQVIDVMEYPELDSCWEDFQGITKEEWKRRVQEWKKDLERDK